MNWSKKLLNTSVIGDAANRIVSMKVNSDSMSIAEHFTTFLQPEFVSTHDLTEEVYKIRHNVYCDELAFLDKHEDGREHDEFDHQSLFALIKHKPTDVYTSCVRIVKSTQQSELLPLEKLCMASITKKELHPRNFARSEIAEISRLAVKAEFRRRKDDQYKGSAQGVISEINYSETELRCFPFIAISLYMAGASLAIDTGVKHCYVMMEPRLARSMKFVGIKFIQLGEPIDYHGLRAPYYINPNIFLENLSPGFKDLYLSIREDLSNQIKKSNK